MKYSTFVLLLFLGCTTSKPECLRYITITEVKCDDKMCELIFSDKSNLWLPKSLMSDDLITEHYCMEYKK